VIFLSFLAEARGYEESTAHGRTIPAQVVRVAVSVVAMGATAVLLSTLALMTVSGEDMGRPLYESISAFATVGLTAGLTEELSPTGLYVLSALMFTGRVGIITFAAALTVRQKRVRYRYPEGRPIIG
jgi:trk system potassium uptake protein